MRQCAIKVLSLVLIVIFAITSIQLVPALAAQGRTAKIYDYSNNVTVTRGKSSIKVYKGMRLKEGDKIKTGANSIAYIEIDSDKVVKMDSLTIITLSNFNGTDKNGSINISLTSGKIYNDIKKKLTKNSTYKVRTPNAVMGVRGTTFVVGVTTLDDNNDKTELTVLDGTVAFATSQQEDANVYVEMNHKANTTELTEDKKPKVIDLRTTDLGTFELDEIVSNTELKDNLSEVLEKENKTINDVIKQAETRESGLPNKDKDDNNGNGNTNANPDNNGTGNGIDNGNINPNNNGKDNDTNNGNTNPTIENGGNGNPNASPNNNGNGYGIDNGKDKPQKDNEGNGNPNASPNNNGNGYGLDNGKDKPQKDNGGNGNPNANPDNKGNGYGLDNGNDKPKNDKNADSNPNINSNSNVNDKDKNKSDKKGDITNVNSWASPDYPQYSYPWWWWQYPNWR